MAKTKQLQILHFKEHYNYWILKKEKNDSKSYFKLTAITKYNKTSNITIIIVDFNLSKAKQSTNNKQQQIN